MGPPPGGGSARPRRGTARHPWSLRTPAHLANEAYRSENQAPPHPRGPSSFNRTFRPTDPDGYEAVNGTSFSAPMVAAGTAWVTQARPDLDQTQLTDLIRVSTHDLGPSGYDPDFGFGVFDLPTALSAQAPSRDPLEPNEDVSWINGKYFGRPDPAIWKGSRQGVYLDARIDRLEDPFDVYRVVVPGHRAMKVSVRPRYGNPTLEIYNGWVKTVISNRGRIGVSRRSGRARETLLISNPFRRRRVAYVSVWPVSLDARYRLTVDRARFR